ncbi:hypothetical protein D1872_315810 [compost metagenome]
MQIHRQCFHEPHLRADDAEFVLGVVVAPHPVFTDHRNNNNLLRPGMFTNDQISLKEQRYHLIRLLLDFRFLDRDAA